MPRARARRASTRTRRAPARTRRATCRRSRPRGPRVARTRARGRGCRAIDGSRPSARRPPAICSSDWTSHGLHEGRPDRGRQRPHPLLDEALDRREADLGALGVERLGDAPRDRMVVRDPEDERRLAVEQSHPDPPRVPSRGSLPSGDDGRSAPDGAPRGARLRARRGWRPRPQRRAAARLDRGASSGLIARGIPFRVVTNFSQYHRDIAGDVVRRERARDRPRPDHHRDLGHRGLHAQRASRTSAVRPRRVGRAGASSTDSTC